MAKGAIAKLGKLKCMIKRWQHRSTSSSKKTNTRTTSNHLQLPTNTVTNTKKEDPTVDLHPVYVGRSRRLYLLRSQLIDHPLFRVLVRKSGEVEEEREVVVDCEVVMFEHLLWMLENDDDEVETRRKESVDELVGFYSSSL